MIDWGYERSRCWLPPSIGDMEDVWRIVAERDKKIVDMQKTIEAHERCEESLRAEIKTLKESLHPKEINHHYWNYRVIKTVIDFHPSEPHHFAICKVHYENAVPVSYVPVPQPVETWREDGETDEAIIRELHVTLKLMLKALEKPILTAKDFEK